MKTILSVAGLLVTAVLLWADELHFSTLKVGAEVYTNVTVTSVTATHIYFTHARGVGSSKLKELEPDVQRMFHYNAAAASVIDAQRAQDNAAYRHALATAPTKRRSETTSEASRQTAPDHGAAAWKRISPPSRFLKQAAPALQVEKWLTAQPDTQGRFVLVDFWATWCGPCRESIPHLNKLDETFKDRLVIVGISAEPEPQVRRMTSPVINYAVGIDTHRRMSGPLQVTRIPEAVLIDPQGIIRFKGHPALLTEENMAKLLEE